MSVPKSWYEPSYPYRAGTHLLAILRDGWARGFQLEQTYDEAHAMGFKDVQFYHIIRLWKHEDAKFARWAEKSSSLRSQ